MNKYVKTTKISQLNISECEGTLEAFQNVLSDLSSEHPDKTLVIDEATDYNDDFAGLIISYQEEMTDEEKAVVDKRADFYKNYQIERAKKILKEAGVI